MPLMYLLKESWQSLKDNPLRSALSIIGVVFGVASVVAMLGIGMGTEAEIAKLLNSLGTGNVHVVSKNLSDEDWQSALRMTSGLGSRDERLLREIYSSAKLTKVASWSVNSQFFDDVNFQVYGTGSNFRSLLGFPLASGRYFSDFEEMMAAPYAVVPERYAIKCCKDAKRALGERIQLNDAWFTIIGVTAAQASEDKTPKEKEAVVAQDKSTGKESGAGSSDSLSQGLMLDENILVPYNSALKRLGSPSTISPYSRIIVHLDASIDPIFAAKKIMQNLKILNRGADVVSVVAAKDIVERKRETSRLFTYFLIVIAFIAIIVGAIGIANVMIASMIERIHEVGLRRAIGAKRKDIFAQFLFEAVLICLLGGAVGGVLGMLISLLIGSIMGWTVIIPVWGILAAMVISLIVGVASGVYPALVASRISPIEALQGHRR